MIGACHRPHRLREVEALLNGRVLDERLIRRAAATAAEEVDPPDDLHADAAYRRGLVATLVERALQRGSRERERVMRVEFQLNGEPVAVEVEPRMHLADCLREELGFTGTHLGCEHGVCGACTVIVDGAAVRSCLMLTVQAEGSSVVTVEGLSSDDALEPAADSLPQASRACSAASARPAC